MPRFHEYEFLQKISKFFKCLNFFDSSVEKTVENFLYNFEPPLLFFYANKYQVSALTTVG